MNALRRRQAPSRPCARSSRGRSRSGAACGCCSWPSPRRSSSRPTRSRTLRCNLDEETLIIGGIIQLYYVRFGIFFGCLGIFVRLVRGELAEHTLHYLFLAPVRRELLLIGKFLAGVLTTVTVFGAGILASFWLMYAHFPAGQDFVRNGPGLAHLLAYLLVATLACVGYGAVFLAMSLLFKNPIVPAVVLLFWEGINGALPVWLKRVSVTYYLKPLFPVELPIEGFLGLFTVVAEPTPAWLAVSGLLALRRPRARLRLLAHPAPGSALQHRLTRAKPGHARVRDALAGGLGLGEGAEAEDASGVDARGDPPVSSAVAREPLEALPGRDDHRGGIHLLDRAETLNRHAYSSLRSKSRRRASASWRSSGRTVPFLSR